MTRASAVIGSVLFFCLAPGTVAGVLPWLISGWVEQPALFGSALTRIAGVALIAAGQFALIESFGRFALQGLGTPAPVLPTKHLVVTGLYRHVRNPMYVAVVTICLGQALLFADLRLIAYALIVWLGFHAFVTLYEEPTLKETFGEAYENYCRNVGRWRPRLSPWHAET
jgi:protein-S-isoprenylcysteine O-methyltransferase Ste14